MSRDAPSALERRGILARQFQQVFMEEILPEALRAQELNGPFSSAHEAYAVLLEEVDEMWDEIKADSPARVRAELVQVAAVAVRYLAQLIATQDEGGSP